MAARYALEPSEPTTRTPRHQRAPPAAKNLLPDASERPGNMSRICPLSPLTITVT